MLRIVRSGFETPSNRQILRCSLFIVLIPPNAGMRFLIGQQLYIPAMKWREVFNGDLGFLSRFCSGATAAAVMI